ncbi:MAG: 3-hydroxyanthranilate 3,4-dioxygenase [Rhodospirillaceae bacterium]|nr:3-hydroxyanthranilate 3,4-dioxygenase [Rhodospirillaceae bacterium]
MSLKSFNLWGWIENNRHLLRPPVLNQTIFAEDDFIVMIVGGPNLRTDYHVDPFEEFFYQLKGNITLKTVQEKKLVDITINEGDIFLLPPNIPHSPQRPDPESIGMVIERIRPQGITDTFVWYCANCASKIWGKEIFVKNIVKDLPPVFEEYYGNIANGNCQNCGEKNPQKITV